MSDFERDEHGRIVLGDPYAVCEWCGAEAEATVSDSGPGVVWWHAPTNCCGERRKRSGARARATQRPRAQPQASAPDEARVIETHRDWWNK